LQSRRDGSHAAPASAALTPSPRKREAYPAFDRRYQQENADASVETQLRRILRANARYYNERYRSGFDLPDLLSGRASRSVNEAIWKIRDRDPGHSACELTLGWSKFQPRPTRNQENTKK
jgi:hypothetical protein